MIMIIIKYFRDRYVDKNVSFEYIEWRDREIEMIKR